MAKSLTNGDIFTIMEEWAPKKLAYDWDPVGMQIGSYTKTVKKIMITLDVMESVVDEAIEKNIDLIIAHHPLFFKPLQTLNVDNARGRMIQKLLHHDITVYASHTNLDIASGGVNDMLADCIGMNANREVLTATSRETLYKLVVYVPISHKTAVMDALANAGAGHIGNYSHCTFQTKGQGTFKPLEGTNPFIGTKDKLEVVDEVKIETIVPKSGGLDLTVQAVLEAHPYEEPAYDIYALANEGKESGIGRIGYLEKETNLAHFCEKVKQGLNVEHLRITGDLSKKVKKVAVLGGSGEKYIHHAKQKGADVYITGDMTFHAAQDAWQMGLAVIDAGHYIEKVMKSGTKTYLEDKLRGKGIEVILSETSTDPFTFL